ncbi:hypothetical protein [Xanthovirga aplysinae]|uniref:hypothetical protein n=1 Tax=Xanthovirga aplysinae TaxID=2529853 RepID=UPI0012BCA0AD|nr:hypothetical protein [Xanthovirga aplysinae]MTI33548.1 hypothetical protein [Xanthovirga aplysinae]
MINLIQPLTAGVLHSFEPDHMTAVTVLASENAGKGEKIKLRTVLKASQWAFGHSVTLLLFGGMAILFRVTMEGFVINMAYLADILLGPIMIWLGVNAIWRIRKSANQQQSLNKYSTDIEFLPHIHGKGGDTIAINPASRSFWVGMLHGLAGAGGILTVDLILQAPDLMSALAVIVIESIGIILAMGIYTYLLLIGFSRVADWNQKLFIWANSFVGLFSIALGIWWIHGLLVEL